ncbi:MAG TPA: M28 family peptidase, partial [Flavobacteriales bacterium]|nr:M28 family peptidase [Flavobacteriales bacterium]
LNTANYMINMDMIGRMDRQWLTVEGVVSAPELVPVTKSIGADFTVFCDSLGMQRSDYISFYNKKIPALQFFTGFHDDYHKPTDDADKINYRAEAKILEYIRILVYKLDQLPKLRFQEYKVWQKESAVHLGIYHEYNYKKGGARIHGLSEYGYALKYGFKKGDVILQIGDSTIATWKDLEKAENWIKKNDTLPVVFKRNNIPDTIIIPFNHYYPK